MLRRKIIDPQISVVMVVQSEGRLAHRSAGSAHRAVSYAREKGLRVELIAVLDSPSTETRAYFDEYAEIYSRIETLELNDRGAARNHGVELASGAWVAFLDPGDLFSENWLASAFDYSSEHNSQKFVLHPELNVFFNRQKVTVCDSVNSDSDDYSPLELMEYAPWTSLSFLTRAFFLDRNHYLAGSNLGFDQQQWLWNCEVIAHGAIHRLVPHTAHFIRVQEERGRPAGQLLPASELFESPVLDDLASREKSLSLNQKPPLPPRSDPQTWSLPKRSAIALLRPFPKLTQLTIDLKLAMGRLGPRPFIEPNPLADCPWLFDEWREIHTVDTDLFPRRQVLRTLGRQRVPTSYVSRHYAEIEQQFGNPTHLFLLPCLTRGGADAEAIMFMTTVLEEEPDSRVTCVLTENWDSSWLAKLPPQISVVHLENLLAEFSAEEKACLLLRLLIQKKPRVIHNVNSALGYKLFTEHGDTLSSHSRLFVSLFGFEFLPGGELGGYAVWDLANCIQYLSRVLTDNQWFADRLCEMYGFSPSRFTVVYVPAPPGSSAVQVHRPTSVLNVLWASRFWREKRPDVLHEIVSQLGSGGFHFHIYGGDINDAEIDGIFEALKRLPNVTTYGAYEDFQALPLSEFDVFLYTSERDGLPNVLLEATAAGLPVIAPDVGGVKEIINDRTGFLVNGPENVKEYVDYLSRIRSNYQITSARLKAAADLIRTRHSRTSFVSILRSLPDFLVEED